MKNSLVIIILLFISNMPVAMGGVWVLEIEYQTGNKKVTGFILADYWADDFDKFVGHNASFQIEFKKRFEERKFITIFKEIVDNEQLAKVATFPMHPFRLVQESSSEILVSDIKNVSLVKLWEKVAYTINVLSTVIQSDVGWISASTTITYPVGNEVGCRLEVHNYTKNSDHRPLVKEFAKLYLKKNTLSEQQKNRYAHLLQKLREKRVIIVELCGC
jgi:pyruvoyl-dependent arginine decarboxylase (PvlArgDC)